MMRMRKMLTALLIFIGVNAMAGQAIPGQNRVLETTTPTVAQNGALADIGSMDSQPDGTVDMIAAICYLLVTIGCFSLFFHIIGEDKNHHVPAS